MRSPTCGSFGLLVRDLRVARLIMYPGEGGKAIRLLCALVDMFCEGGNALRKDVFACRFAA